MNAWIYKVGIKMLGQLKAQNMTAQYFACWMIDSFVAGEISSDLYHALQCDIEISKVKSFELEKKWWKSS